MIEILIAIGGLVGGFLIALGVHKKEHEVLNNNQTDFKADINRLDKRVDGHDVIFATFQTTLEYLVKAVDRNFDAIEEHKKEEKEQ